MTTLKTIEFLTFIETPGLRADLKADDLNREDIQKAVDACPHREKPTPFDAGGERRESALCRAMSNRLGWDAGLERSACAGCQIHGGPDDPGNAKLLYIMKGCVYSRTVPNPSLPGTYEKPDAAAIDKCLAAAKLLAGAEPAADLITTMVATGVLTPEEAVDLHEKHGLIVAEPEPVDGGADAK